MSRDSNPLFVGTNRHVAALDPDTGEELWRTKLPHGGSCSPVTMLLKGQRLFVGCHGHVYSLDARNGEILWENSLPRMNYCAVLLAQEGATRGVGTDEAVLVEELRRQQAAAAAAAAT